MGDRRIGDRRAKENGVIKIKFEDAVKYIIIGVILIISIATNIVLAVKVHKYKEMTDLYLYDEDGIYGEYDDEVDVDELMNTINSIGENTAE